VSIKTPESIKYDVDAVYYIDRSDATEATAIQIQAGLAVQEFIAWQKEKLGRDINPTELYYRLRAAGGERAGGGSCPYLLQCFLLLLIIQVSLKITVILN